MNIKFKEIDIENFRSIEKAHIVLENQGTVIVKGINEYEDKATSNGSGKSSIFEAITFALFEETSSGEKDVANRIKNNGYVVNLRLEIDGIDYLISRENKNNKTTVAFYKENIDISARNKTDTNKLIESTIGINKNIYLDSVFLSQNASTNLTSLTPTARKERLEILTSTDVTINNFKEKLKNKQIEYEALCVDAQMNLNKLNGNKESLQEQLTQLNAKILEIDEQIRQRDALGNIDTIENEIKTTETNIKIQNSDLDEKEKEIQEREKEIEEYRQIGQQDNDTYKELNKQLNEKRQEYSNIQNDIDTHSLKQQNYQKEITRINKEIEKIKNSDKCPTCGRKYADANEEHIAQTVKELQDQITENQKQIELQETNKTSLVEQSEKIFTEGKDLSSQVEQLGYKIDSFNKNITDKETQRKYLLEDRQRISNNIKILQDDLTNWRNKKEQLLQFKVGDKTEIETMIKDVNDKINSLNTQVKNEQDKYVENNDKVNCIKHSLQLITKDFRTFLLKNSIEYLNKLLERYSSDLFSNEKDIVKISENDTKLDIMLGNATYESLSGGEKTRVNIALLLAQKSLASVIGNISYNIIILDEILGYCDNQAEINVIDLITKELESLESIYMVSHKEIPIGYDTQLIIVKNKQGLSNVRCY